VRDSKRGVVWCRKRSSEMSAGIDGWNKRGRPQNCKTGYLLAHGNGIAKERVLKKQ
jgi:hypothetical protein